MSTPSPLAVQIARRVNDLYSRPFGGLRDIEKCVDEILRAEVAAKDAEIARLKAEVIDWKQGSDVEARLHDEARAEVGRLKDAVRWALGENGNFSPRERGQGAYWWRSSLRRRAGLDKEPTP